MDVVRPVYSIERTAELLDCPAAYVRALLRRGLLEGFKLPSPRAAELRVRNASRWRVYAASIAKLTGQKLERAAVNEDERISDAEAHARAMRAMAETGYLRRRLRTNLRSDSSAASCRASYDP